MIFRPWRWPAAAQILAGLVIGLVLGFFAHRLAASPEASARLAWWLANLVQPLGRLFVRVIFMVVVPLVGSAVVLGVAEMGDARRLGRLGLRTLAVTLALTGASALIGLSLMQALHPGRDLAPETREKLLARPGNAAAKFAPPAARPLADTLVDLVPQNPLGEAANAFSPGYTGSGLIGVMVAALFIGAAVVALPRERTAPLLAVVQVAYEIAMKIVGWAMRLAPLGVGCLGFALTATTGVEALRSLGGYVAVCFVGYALHQFGVYSLALVIARAATPLEFFRQVRAAMATAFATASSNATLPVTLRVADEELRVPSHVARFVLTVGTTANHCGTALYTAATAVFLAQVFGVTLEANRLVFVALMAVLSGVGTAGVPGGVVPLLVATLAAIGVRGEAVAIVLGVDRLLDMGRTTLNVTGNLATAAIVARGEGEAEPVLLS